MTVYVDNARIPARVGNIQGRWSHLTADTREELHRFAESIGLKRSWFQVCKSRAFCKTAEDCVHWHYDVTDSKRAEAVAAGAQEMDLRKWADLTLARREQMKQGGEQDA